MIWRRGLPGLLAVAAFALCGVRTASADYVVTNNLRDVVVRQWMDRDLPHVDGLGTWTFTTGNKGDMTQGANSGAVWLGFKCTEYPHFYANASGRAQTIGSGSVPADAIRCHAGKDSGPMYVTFSPAASGTYRIAIATWALDRGSVLVSADDGAGTLLAGTAQLNTNGSTTRQTTVSDWLTLAPGDKMRLVIDCNGDQSCDATGLACAIQRRLPGDAPAVEPYRAFRFTRDWPATSNVNAGVRSALASYDPPTVLPLSFTDVLKALRAAAANPFASDALFGSWKLQTRGGNALVNWTGSAAGPTAGMRGTSSDSNFPQVSGNVTATNLVGGLAVGTMSLHPADKSTGALSFRFTPAKTGWYQFDYRARRTNLDAGGDGVSVGVYTDAKVSRTLGTAVVTPVNGGWVGSGTGWRQLTVGESAFLNVDPRSSYSYDGSELSASLSYRAISVIESCSLADFIRTAFAEQANPVTTNTLFGTWTMKQKNGTLLAISTTARKFMPASGQQYQHFSAPASGTLCSMHPPNNDTASHVVEIAADAKGWYRLVVRAHSSSGGGNGVKVTVYGETTSDALGSFVTTTDKAWGTLTTAWRQLAAGGKLHLMYDNNGADANDSTETEVWLERAFGDAPPSATDLPPVPNAFTNDCLAVTLGSVASPGAAFVPFDGYAYDQGAWYAWNAIGTATPRILANASDAPLADDATGLVYAADELRLCPGSSRPAALRIETLPGWKTRRYDLDFELRCPSDGTSLMSLGEGCYFYLNGVETDALWLVRNAEERVVRRVSGLKAGDVVELHVKSCPPAGAALSSDEAAVRVTVRRELVPGLTVIAR